MTHQITSPLGRQDAVIAAALDAEITRQQDHIELIASENIISPAILQTLGHNITNKTLEGYPKARFHAGGVNVDTIEQTAIDQARQLFDCTYVNVQPHSGSQANLAVFFALVKTG